jgi:gliding motility-associated-like protein
MKHFLKIFLFLIFNFSFLIESNATHLMGGWCGYAYLGLNPVSGNYKYQVTFKVYRYCDDNSLPCGTCTTAVLDASIQMGAYIQDFLNPNDPNKVLYAAFTIPLTSQSWVPLPGAVNCAAAPTVCVEEGIYTLLIELPPSNGGYHLLFERCCRNWNIINLSSPSTDGQTYYAFIPPTFINNSSPVQAVPPVPYICANDTASILNTAIDPDGDAVVYTLVQPYTTSTGFAINPPPNPYTFPIPFVTYAAGYSASQPFGAGGYASVNSFTGLSKYLSPTTGNYVVAVEMREFRNNQLVGITRLDMQIIVINCPPNNAPVLSSTTSQTAYIANEGDSLCFPVTFSDANGDSVFISANGTLFNNPPTNPAATFSPNPNSGNGSVTSNFCWDLACGQTGNFIFIVQSPDNGCPPKITNVVYTIQVLPYVGPSSITGPNPLCSNSFGIYSVPLNSGSSFTWVATGGAIVSGQGTNSVTVNWGNSASGTISVTSYNSRGCPEGPISMTVNLQSPPVINAGPNTTLCTGSSVTLTSSGGGTYSWAPATGLSNTSIANPVASPTNTTNYIVTVTSAIGCTNTDTVSISVNQQPSVNAGNDITICTGSAATIGGSPTAPAGSTYNWSPATGLSCTTCANPSANPAATTTYTVIATASTSCIDTDFVIVTVIPAITANAGPDVTVCPGSNTTLSGSGGTNYNWSPASSLSNPNISNPVASPTTTTTYTLVVSVSICSAVDFVTMTTLPVPAVSAGADASICIGNSATLNATGAGTFVWSPSTGLSCTACPNPVANPTVTTNYTVTITNASACTNTDIVQVTVNPLPLANAGPKPGWVCPGFTVTLSSANGTIYSWAPAGTLNNPNISNPAATPTATTTYTVNITDANGCANWDTVTISPSPNIPTNAGADISICIGKNTTLGGNPTAPSNVTGYLWSPAGGLNSSTIANPVANPIGTSTYIVTTSSNTCTGKDTVIVVVNALPVVSAGADVSVCVGSATTLTGSGGQTYSWSTGGTTTSISVAPTSQSSYTVIGTNANGCTNSDSATVFVNSLPAVSAGADVSVCVGSATTLTGSGGQTYSWSTGATTTAISVAPTIASSYTVIGTDGNGCKNIDSATVFVNSLPVVSAGPDVSICIGNSTTLTGSGASTYSWSTGVNAAIILVTPTATTTYTVFGTDSKGCKNIDTVTVHVSPLPVVSAGADVSICLGSNTTLTGSGGITYLWSPAGTLNNTNVSNPVANPTGSITYTLIATDGNSCSNMDTVKVTVLALPAIITSNDTAICAGDSALLSATGGINYSWSPGSSLNISTISNPIATPTATTNYTVTVTGMNGCKNQDTVKVTAHPLPTIDAGANTILCPGDSIPLNATGGISYQWSPTAGLSNPNISNPYATPSVVTTYSVIGTDANGCKNTDSIKISIGIIPSANFGYLLSLSCDGMEAQFTDSSINATAWSWNFGDGNSSTLQNPAHLFPYNSNYLVVLTVLNPPCADTSQKILSVNNLSDYVSIQTSNVFTPNSDGVNDCFKLNTNGRFEGCADLSIYNRWGILVYHSEYSGSCWDGHTSAGVVAPEGTYFYIFDLNGIQLKGFITVLR